VALRVPGGPGIRDDSGVEEGDEVPSYYDPLVSKLVAWGEDRAAAIARMRRAVREYQVLGIKTTLPFFERVLRHPDFVAGAVDTSFVERLGPDARDEAERPWSIAVAAAAVHAYRQRRGRRTVPGAAAVPSAWRQEGRVEAQRGRG
jgi:acetyl-CoA carboxylase biotin carboxylase subunit